MESYIKTRGMLPLPPQVCEKLFEQYMNGSSIAEICKMYSEYDASAIFFTAYHYDWPARRDDLSIDIQDRIKQKILNSKFQQLELVDSMIRVAHIEAMGAFQTYIKHPSDKNIPKNFRIKTIKDLAEAIEMMAKIVGQDMMKKVEIIKTDREEEPKKKIGEAELTDSSAKDIISAINKVSKG